MLNGKSLKKWLTEPLVLIGFALFLFLCLLSVLWYKERVLYLDSAYYAFNLINTEFPAAEHNRYALWIYQLIPWGLLKTGFGIPMVLRAYSLSHILIHFLAFCTLAGMKRYGLAALLALLQVLSYRECFFLTVNETALAITASLMLAASLEHYGSTAENNVRKSIVQSAVYFLCIFTALFSHPTAMLMIPFVLVYHLFMHLREAGHRRAFAIALGEFITGVAVKFLSGKKSGYEDDLFAQLGRTGEILSGLSDVYSFRFFFGDLKLNSPFFHIYIIPMLLSVVALYGLIRQKRFLLTGFYLLSSAGIWLLIAVMFNRGDGTIFMEKNFTPWVFVALYPLAFFAPAGRYRLASAVVYLSVILYSFYGIAQVRPMYAKRLWLMDRLITERNPAGAPKLIVQDSTVNHEEWLGIWALPYETLLMSKVKGIPNTTARIYRNEEHINKELQRDDIFLGADFIPVLPDTVLLNRKYFRLEKGTYRAVEAD